MISFPYPSPYVSLSLPHSHFHLFISPVSYTVLLLLSIHPYIHTSIHEYIYANEDSKWKLNNVILPQETEEAGGRFSGRVERIWESFKMVCYKGGKVTLYTYIEMYRDVIYDICMLLLLTLSYVVYYT